MEAAQPCSRGGEEASTALPRPPLYRFTHNALMNTHNALMKTMAHCESRARYTEVPDQAISDCKGIRKPEPLAQRIRWIPVQTHRQPPPPRPLDRQ